MGVKGCSACSGSSGIVEGLANGVLVNCDSRSLSAGSTTRSVGHVI